MPEEAPISPAYRDRYQSRGLLGRGGSGEVYRVFDAQLGHEVAWKRMHSSAPASSARLKAEFRARAEVHHPNLLQVFDLVVADDDAFFTMELIDGHDLLGWDRASRATDDAADPVARIAGVLAPVVSALAALHDAGFVHRDVKPGNVLVDRGGRARLADLGLAVAFTPDAGRPVRAPLYEGTPAYMAPELLLRRRPTTATDVYAIGALIHELLVGAPLIPGIRRDAEACAVAYGRCAVLIEALLDPRPEQRPSAHATELALRELGGAEPRPLGGVTLKRAAPRSGFVGRTRELRQLAAAIESPRPPSVVAVHGPSGIGKTALISRLVDELVERRPGLRVLRGRCRRHEHVAFCGMDGVIDDLAIDLEESAAPCAAIDAVAQGALVRLFPALPLQPAGPALLESGADAQVRRLAFEALRALIADRAVHHPLVIWIDDLQWADEDTLALLSSLLDGAGLPGCVLIVTYRRDAVAGDPVRTVVGAAAGAGTGQYLEVPLRPLALAEVADLLREAAPQTAAVAASLAQLALETEGYPIFARMLAYHDGRIARDPAVGDRQVRLDALINLTIDGLDAEQRALMDVLCMAPAPVPLRVVSTAVGLTTPAMSGLRALEQLGIVTPSAGREAARFQPFHDSVRQARRRHLDHGMRARLHRGLARAHEQLDTRDFAALIYHHAEVGALEQAGTYAIRAGDGAFAELAFAAAATHYEQAIDYLPGRAEPWLLHEGVARAHANLGHNEQAAIRFEEAAQLRRAVHGWDVPATRLAVQAAEQRFHGGDVIDGYRLLRLVLPRFGTRLPRSQVTAIASSLYHRGAFLLGGHRGRTPTDGSPAEHDALHLDTLWTAATGLAHINHVLADAFLVRHVRAAARVGDRTRLVRSLCYEAAAEAALGGRFDRTSDRQVARAERLMAPTDDAYQQGWYEACRAATGYFRAQWPTVMRHAARADAHLARCPGTSWERAVNFGYWTFALALTADVEQLAEVRRCALEDTGRRRDRLGENHCRSGLGALHWLYRDDVDGARREAAELLEIDHGPTRPGRPWPETSFRTPDFQNLVARTNLDLYAGEAELAFERMRTSWRDVERAFLTRVQFVGADLHFLFARAALSTRRADAVGVARRHAAALRKNGNPSARPYAAVVDGVLAARRGRRARAATALTAAVDGFAGLGMVAHACAARHRLGELNADAAGATLCEAALAELAARAIVAPARIIELFAPPL